MQGRREQQLTFSDALWPNEMIKSEMCCKSSSPLLEHVCIDS